MIDIANRIAPIIILLFIGKILSKKNVISQDTVAEIKKLVINLALPAVLFNSFLNIDLQPNYLWFLPIIFIYCVLLFILGEVLQRVFKTKSDYFPFLMTGFEYGMIGVSLFGAAYGLDQLGKLAVVDLGQEFFIWIFYIGLLSYKQSGGADPKKLLKIFVTTPVIIAIFASLLINLSGLNDKLVTLPFASGVLVALEMIGSLTVPLILLVVGYGIRIDMGEFFFSAHVILIRMLISVPTALLLNRYVVRGLMGLDVGFEAALFTLWILPPPFILTLFMKQDNNEEMRRVDNTLTMHTIVTILIFIVYYALNPML